MENRERLYSKEMDRLSKWFKGNIDCTINESDYDRISAITDDDVKYLIVSPNEGTDYKYMIRVSIKLGFDRWSNSCAIEKLFEDADDIICYLLNQESIYKDLYKYMCRQYEEEIQIKNKIK